MRRLFDVDSSQDGSKRQERDNKVPGHSPYKRSDCQLYPGQGPRFSIEQLNGFQDYNELVSALITSETPPQIKKNKTANLEQSD